MFRQDTEERVRLRRGFQVEVMLADDALRIARLNRRFADGAKLCDEHRNERMPEHVVRESEFLRELQPALLKIADDQREFVEWVGAQPGRLVVWGALMFLAWPLALFAIRDRAADKGLYPDGDSQPPAENQAVSLSFSYLLRQYSFWLLLIGSFCSIGAIGAVNFHMKFVFLDQGFTDHTKEGLMLLNSTWRVASMTILATSLAGRLAVGGLADRFSKKWVMTATYFLVAATIPMLLTVSPSRSPVAFAVLFGFGMGADYMLIPLMAAEQ